jgi:hypothetical protein
MQGTSRWETTWSLPVDKRTPPPDFPRPKLRDSDRVPSTGDKEIWSWLSRQSQAGGLLNAELSQRDVDLMLTFAERMATQAVRARDGRYIWYGLLAIGISMAADYREILVPIALLFDAARRVGADFGELATRAAAATNGELTTVAASFLARDPRTQGLDAFYYRIVEGDDGPAYEWNPPAGIPRTIRDLGLK